jgi:hypothetical protein
MPHYPFLIVNEKKIREHFNEWKKYSSAHPESPAFAGYKSRIQIIETLDRSQI